MRHIYRRMRMLMLMLGMVMLICCFGIVPSCKPVKAASETYSVYVEGKCNYDYANQVLELLNKARKKAGKAPLIMNEELLETAMQRAAEIAIDFNHVRPNGKQCFSASDLMYGENIAMGQKTPKAVLEAWTKSHGHYENMMREEYQSVGIGVFYANGHYYWVQCFGFTGEDEVNRTGVKTKTYAVKVKGNLTFSISPSKKTLKKTKTVTPKVTVKNRSYSSFSVQIKAKSLKYSTANKKIATVSSGGKITAKKKGTVKITCKLGTKKKTITIKVE